MTNKTPKIADVAAHAGVGVGTVSRVLNDDPHVNATTREKVEQAMRELRYKPNTFARGLKSHNSKSIGVFVADITNPLLAKITRVIEETIQKDGYSLLLFDTNMHKDRVNQCIDITQDKMLDGLFILGEHITDDSQLNKLTKLNIPIVTVTMHVPMIGSKLPDNFASITINNERAAFCATDFLVSHGAKKIALIMSPEDDENVGYDRYAGYCKALEHSNIPVNENLLCVNERLCYQAGYDSIRRLINEKIEFDAVFAMADTAAFGALRALYETGIRVPEDVSVVGFDGIEQGEFSVPSLTTIDQPRYLMAQESARIMMELIQKKEVSNREIILDFNFVQRESTTR